MGAGKTSAMLFIKHYIEEYAKELGKKILVVYVNKDFDRLISSFFILNHILTGNFLNTKSESEAEEITKEEIKKYHHIFFLFDIPEDVSEFREFGKFLDFILRNHFGSIYVSMNYNHFKKITEVTNIIGTDSKITTYNLERDFNEDLMIKIAESRLKVYREENYNGDTLFPFTFKAIQQIANFSHFNPRNFIVGCNTCLFKASEQNIQIIDKEFVEKILIPVFAVQIIDNHITDNNEKKIYMAIYDCLKNDFSGKCDDMQKLSEKLNGKNVVNLSYTRIIDRLKKMHEWNIVSLQKNFLTPRGKSIEVIV
jgi:hypothetical protein